MHPQRSLAVAALVIGLTASAGCDVPVSPSPTATAARPAVRMDPTWQAADGRWTFTGHVDPQGDPTDVVLEIGPGPATARQFDLRVPVAADLAEPGPVTITTSEIPDLEELCVRFTATNDAGTSSSAPLCFPHDLPSFVVDVVAPAAAFTSPIIETTTELAVPDYVVAWTETELGTGVVRRSVQRHVASQVADGCGAFAEDGPASEATSPLAVTDLLDGHCYRWAVTLRDGAGNTSTTTSGTVRVQLAGP